MGGPKTPEELLTKGVESVEGASGAWPASDCVEGHHHMRLGAGELPPNDIFRSMGLFGSDGDVAVEGIDLRRREG